MRGMVKSGIRLEDFWTVLFICIEVRIFHESFISVDPIIYIFFSQLVPLVILLALVSCFIIFIIAK